MNNWRQCQWGDIATIEYGKGLRGYKEGNGRIPVFGTNGQIGWHTEYLWSEAGVIIGRKGAYRGVHYSKKPFYVIDTAFYLKPKSNFNMRWAYYELLTHDINGMDSGSAIPSTSREDFYRMSVKLPPLPIQRRIAKILGRLDDKIELNRRINRTLEEMAQALYKHWFVDFGPFQEGAFVESALGLIPAGWAVRTYKQLTSKIGSGSTPRGGSSVYVDAGINLIRSQNVYDSTVSWKGLAKIGPEHAEKLRNVTVNENDVLINITGDSILRTCVVEPAILPAKVNQHVAIIRPNAEIPTHFLHQHLLRPETKQLLLGYSSGGTRKAVTKGNLESIRIAVPPPRVLDSFQQKSEQFFQQIVLNRVESKKLAEIRDYLLPKLLSGQLVVEAVEEVLT